MKNFKTRIILSALIFLAFVSFLIYSLTAFRTITWWDSSEYTTAAVTLGVPHPPGSLLLVLLGWIVSKLPVGISKVFSLNLFAGLMAAFTVVIIGYLATKLIDKNFTTDISNENQSIFIVSVAAILFSCLIFAFSETLWLHATKFTPYILTALFTALILWAMIKWWDRADQQDAYKWLFLIALLFGLDFSVHRTNLLMLPGLFVWIYLRHPKAFSSKKNWLYGSLGILAGLAVHLLLIPIAARQPSINAGNPSSVSRFWDYISLKQYSGKYGGKFLINLYPRKAPFWSYQVVDYLTAFSKSFFSFHKKLGFLGLFPGLLGLSGLIFIWKKNRKFALSLLTLFFLSSMGAVIYFNIPLNFFRPMHRHYLPSFVIFALLMGYGAGYICLTIWKVIGKFRYLYVGIAGVLLLITPISQVTNNFRKCDGHKRYFTVNYGKNIFNSLSSNAIILTFGDNDTYPLWYLQKVEGVRPDVTICNFQLMNASWYMSQILSQDSNFPLSMSIDTISQLRVIPWEEKNIVVPIDAEKELFQLPEDFRLADSINLYIPSSTEYQYLPPNHQLLLRIIEENRWKRPIYFSGLFPSIGFWARPYFRFEGLVGQLIPVDSVPINKGILRKNLFSEYNYQGYADTSIQLKNQDRTATNTLYWAFIQLAREEEMSGNKTACVETIQKLTGFLPPERIDPPAQFKNMIKDLSGDESLKEE